MKIIALMLAGLALAGTAAARDYKPVTCTSVKPYAGSALAAPDVTAEFDIAPVPDAALDSSARLDAGFAQALTATKASAMTAAVAVPGKGRWQSGDDRLFYWASAGKTFTAIAVLQLAEEGKLSLTDPVSTWIAGVPNGDVITVAHLLDHTSGLFSANEDLAFRKKPHRMTFEEELKILNRHGAMFCPGENWRYSNSGYMLLGAILEKAEGKPYPQILTQRVVDRLGLKHTRIIAPDSDVSDIAAPVSQTAEPAIGLHQPGAAGPVAASASDMVTVWQALLEGRLLKPATVRGAFARLYPMFGQPQFYGQGVMAYVLPVEPATIWIGHSGGAPGVKAIVAYSLQDKAFVAVALSGDGPAEATAALLLRSLK